jgi:zinc transport system substrate-binding protein
VATIPPVGMILGELGAGRAEVLTLLQPGDSPHTYDPRVSDARAVADARALFSVSDALDGWAAQFSAAQHVQLLELVPTEHRRNYAAASPGGTSHEGHAHAAGAVDPHFWTDPVTVRELLPGLVGELIALDPAGTDLYRANAASFDSRLAALHEDIAAGLAPYAGARIAVFHGSMEYFAARYGLRIVAVVEAAPGLEPSAADMRSLLETLTEQKPIALFLEPQLNARAAIAIAEASGVALSFLDPLGGMPETPTYAELIIYNAERIAEAARE